MCLRRLAEIAGLAEIPQSSGRTAESQVIQGIPAEQEGAMHSNAMVATNERPVTLPPEGPVEAWPRVDTVATRAYVILSLQRAERET